MMRNKVMARRAVSIDEKIEKTETAMFKAKDKYDALVEELKRLHKQKDELKRKEIWEAIDQSDRSLDEILDWIKNGNSDDEWCRKCRVNSDVGAGRKE